MMEEKLNIEFKKEYRIDKEEHERQRKLLDGMILDEIRRNVLIGNNSVEIQAVIKVYVTGDEIKTKIDVVETL